MHPNTPTECTADPPPVNAISMKTASESTHKSIVFAVCREGFSVRVDSNDGSALNHGVAGFTGEFGSAGVVVLSAGASSGSGAPPWR